jgi:thiol-disulfide isomerase/thioredoxin
VEETVRTALELAGEQRKRVLIRYSKERIAPRIAAPGFIVVNISDPSISGQNMAVLDGAGRVIAEHQGNESAAFIVQNAPVPPAADELLSSALTKARAGNKLVLLDFRADWCAPCFRLDRFLHDPAVSAVLKEIYSIATVDLGFGTRGRELAYKLGAIESDGIPWIAILNPDGKVLATSTNEKRNVGFPSTKDDKTQFVHMLLGVANQSSAENERQLAKALESY